MIRQSRVLPIFAFGKDFFDMGKNNEKMVEQITSMDVDFAQW